MMMNLDDTFSPPDPQLGISTSQSVVMNDNDFTESFVDISHPGHHTYAIPGSSSLSSSSLSMDHTDSTESYVNDRDPDHHPHLALQSLSSSASHADVSPNIFIDESSRSVHDYKVMDYFDGSNVIGFKFTPKQVRDILHKSTYFISEEVSSWNHYVIVPYGTNLTNYISVYAAREGLHINALYDELGCLVPAPQGISAEELVKRNFLNGLCQKQVIYVTRYHVIMYIQTNV
jgi:hypothetical protein